MASFSGEENVVRLLLNSQGVQVDAPTTNLVKPRKIEKMSFKFLQNNYISTRIFRASIHSIWPAAEVTQPL